MKLAQTSRKSAVLGRRYCRISTAFFAALLIASCGGRAKDQREPGEPSAGVGGADNVASAGGTSSGGASSGGQTEAGGTTADGGTGASQGAGGSFGGAFESEDFEGSCRYVECAGCFRCVELYGPRPGCGTPVPETTQERVDEPCPRDGLIGVCIEEHFVRYYYENSDISLEYLETNCVLVEN